MSEPITLEQARRARLQWWVEQGHNPFANGYMPTHHTSDVIARYGQTSAEELEHVGERFALAGRLMLLRVMGKLAFGRLRDRDGDLQVAFDRATLGEALFEQVKKMEVGDIIGVEGTPIRTRTGELTIKVLDTRLLTKGLRPLPEKYHGLKDVEQRYRQRYVDLFMNPEVQDIFKRRSQIVSHIRHFLEERDFMEVETPMMHPIAGGAAARPFVTHHNALDMDLFLRIAPELYLKRLLVGGLERVFEINRSFRNEGIDTHHNPEFTMLEFYWAYATYEDLMALTEQLIGGLVKKLTGGYTLTYNGEELDFSLPWRRLPIREAVLEYGASHGVTEADLADRDTLAAAAKRLGLEPHGYEGEGRLLMDIYEDVAEGKLRNPTFSIDFPLEVSPLSRRRDSQPDMVDRFELIIAGMEVANAFSELNDPIDQRERFEKQIAAKNAGDDEAFAMDEDFVRALEYGMPPAAGQGIGIDRLVMLLTDSPSIREVVLFPLLRHES